MRRVVITGAGTINPLGHDVPATLAAMQAGTCAIGPLDIRDVDRLQIQIGAQVRGYDEADHFSRQDLSLQTACVLNPFAHTWQLKSLVSLCVFL